MASTLYWSGAVCLVSCGVLGVLDLQLDLLFFYRILQHQLHSI